MQAHGDDETLTIGLVGLGEMSIPYAERLVELGHDIVGTDADGTKQSHFRALFDVETYDTPDQLFESGVDAVVITLPTKYHEDVVTGALEAGLDVFIEKPLAHQFESAQRIASAAQRSDSVVMVGNYFQFDPHTQILRSYLEDGYLGELSHIHVTHVWRRRVPKKGSWFTTDAVAGGGVLMDRGSFALGLLLEFLDYPDIDRVMAEGWSDFSSHEDYSYLVMYGEQGNEQVYDVEDALVALIEFENGCTVSLDFAWATNVGRRDHHSYQIRGTEAGALLDLSDMEGSLSFNEARSTGADHLVDTQITAPDVDLQLEQIRQFLSCVKTGEEPTINTVENALAVNHLIDQLYQDADLV